MLTLRDCATEGHSAWWDVEVEIQRELEALDADEVAHASGDSPMEVLEAESMFPANHFTDHFERLMDRLQLQNKKLLHFEESVFSPRRHIDAVCQDIGGSTSARVDLERPQKCGSYDCLLSVQNLIRPLCSLDQEDSYCFKDAYTCAETTKKKIARGTTELESYQRRPFKGLKRLRNGRLNIHNIEDVKVPLCTSSKKTITGVENLKDRILHSFRLSSKTFKFHDLKVTSAHKKLRLPTQVSDLLWTKNLGGTFAISTIRETGFASHFSSQAGPHSMILKPGYIQPTISLQHAHPHGGKQKQIIYAFLDLFKSRVIPVNGTNWDVTRTRASKQPGIKALLSAWRDYYIDTSWNPKNYNADEKGLRALLSLFPELKKLVAKSMNHLGLRLPCLLTEVFFHLLSLDHKRLRLCEVASRKDEGEQLLSDMKDSQLNEAVAFHINQCENSKDSSPCTLEKVDVCNMDVEGLLQIEADLEPEQRAHLHEVGTFPAHESERIKDFLPYTLEEADVCDKNGGELLQNQEDCEPEQVAHVDILVKLQATVNGFLAKKHHQVKLDINQRELCYYVTKIQACWRGWAARNLCLKKTVLLKEKYLQGDSPMHSVDSTDLVATKMAVHLRVVTLQSFVRGALARKLKRRLLLQREKKTCNLIIKVQALWRGWIVRKLNLLETFLAERRLQEDVTVKTHAVWRGRRIRKWNLLEKLCAERRLQEAVVVRIQAAWRRFRTRRRFCMALETSRYDEDDDSEYAAVDDIDILTERIWSDDYARVYHDNVKQFLTDSTSQVSHELLKVRLEVGNKGATDVEQEESGEGSKVTDKEHESISPDMKNSNVFLGDFRERNDTTTCFRDSSEDNPALSQNSFLHKGLQR